MRYTQVGFYTNPGPYKPHIKAAWKTPTGVTQQAAYQCTSINKYMILFLLSSLCLSLDLYLAFPFTTKLPHLNSSSSLSWRHSACHTLCSLTNMGEECVTNSVSACLGSHVRYLACPALKVFPSPPPCYLGHMACLPPSTGNVAPVMKDASLDARKAMTLATSSASPGRPKA